MELSGGILFYYLRRYKTHLFFVILSVLFSGITSLGIGKIIGYTVMDISEKGSLLNVYILFSIGIALISVAASLRIIIIGRYGENLIKSLREDLFEKIINSSVKIINKDYYTIHTTLTTDITTLQNFLASGLSIFLRNAVTLVGSAFMLFYIDAELSLYTILVTPIILPVIIVIGKRVKSYSIMTREGIEDISATIDNSLNNIKIIKSFAAEDLFISIFRDKTKALSALSIKHSVFRGILIGAVIFFVFSSIAIIILIGIHSISSGKINAAMLSEFVFYALLAASSTNAITDLYTEIQKVLIIDKRLTHLYNMQDEKNLTIKSCKGAISNFSTIQFKNVDFHYSDNHKIIDNINFSINRGEMIAIVGPSGAGKSTIFNLLLKFNDVSSGMISIDGVNINEITPIKIRTLFSLVAQEPALFHTSILKNIMIANKDSSIDEVLKICDIMGISEFTKKLDHGLNAQINKTREFSRGQQQRIAIARAILKKSPIMLLDEATSSLDAENAKMIRDHVEKLKGEKTIVTITHDLNTIKNADKIVVLECGKITGIGSHDELLIKNRTYRSLASTFNKKPSKK